MIRSSRPFNNIHEAVKADLIRKGISADRIHPPLGETKPELKLAGFTKQKHQDVCVSPEGYVPEEEKTTEGILREATDYYGKDYTERTISINVRSQMSSLAKNFDTLYERTIAEAQNLHVRCPKMVLGEVYMIPEKEYDASVMNDNAVAFIDRWTRVPSTLSFFSPLGRCRRQRDFPFPYYKIFYSCFLVLLKFRVPFLFFLNYFCFCFVARGCINKECRNLKDNRIKKRHAPYSNR